VVGVVWDTGYRPAYDHEGASVTVLTDGRVLLHGHRDDTGAAVTGSVLGWRAGCDCGWTGAQLFPRAEYELPPAEGDVPIDGISPKEVDELCTVEWEAHLHQVLPLLAVHDAARKLAEVTPAYDDARTALADAVRTARTRQPAASWQTIADVVGITRQSAHERWS
jgi:hypothetical protein